MVDLQTLLALSPGSTQLFNVAREKWESLGDKVMCLYVINFLTLSDVGETWVLPSLSKTRHIQSVHACRPMSVHMYN